MDKGLSWCKNKIKMRIYRFKTSHLFLFENKCIIFKNFDFLLKLSKVPLDTETGVLFFVVNLRSFSDYIVSIEKNEPLLKKHLLIRK